MTVFSSWMTRKPVKSLTQHLTNCLCSDLSAVRPSWSTTATRPLTLRRTTKLQAPRQTASTWPGPKTNWSTRGTDYGRAWQSKTCSIWNRKYSRSSSPCNLWMPGEHTQTVIFLFCFFIIAYLSIFYHLLSYYYLIYHYCWCHEPQRIYRYKMVYN